VFSASGRHKRGGPDFGRGLYLFSRLSWRPHSSFRLTMSLIGPELTSPDVRHRSAIESKAEVTQTSPQVRC
jgi:hypothetical protein